ncbi:MAG: baseplate J/gp47 family protein [Sphingomonadaceae bacterium]
MAISSDLFTGVDFSRLPAPDVLEQLDYASLRDTAMADFLALMPEFNAVSPADPIYKFVEMLAYYCLLIRQRVNEAARATMLAYAQGADIDAIAARYGLERFELSDGSLESDTDFRARVAAAPEAWSVAGPVGAYVQGAKNASGDVAFASAISPAPGEVLVSVQARKADSVSVDGSASAALIAQVADYLDAEDRRPLTDQLTVQSAQISPFAVNAQVRLFSGPDPASILAAARAKLDGWLLRNCRLGRDITADSIHAALTVEGVSKVTLTDWADITCDATQAGYCTAIAISHAGVGE